MIGVDTSFLVARARAEHPRKRLLDTLIGATWHAAGITEVYTLNPGDFEVFDHSMVLPLD